MTQKHSLFTRVKQIHQWLDEMSVYDYFVSDELIVNVKNDVNLTRAELTHLPVQFGWVEGEFNISHNQLTILKGSPSEVGGIFDCSYNQLSSLEFSPKDVQNSYRANHNQITSFKGITSVIYDDLLISHNALTSFKEMPQCIHGDFYVSDNNIYSFDGLSPYIVSLICHNNPINSFQTLYDLVMDGLELDRFCCNDYLSGTEKKFHFIIPKIFKSI